MWRIKRCCWKNDDVENEKRVIFFYEKYCLNKKWSGKCDSTKKWVKIENTKIWIGLRCVSFFLFLQDFVCACFGNKSWSVKPFCAQHLISYFSCYACMHHMHIKTLSEILFSQICFLRISMGDRLEARISAIENIQEEFGHDFRKVKEHLARLTSLFEDYIKTQAVLPRGPSPVPTQYASCLSPRPRAICHVKLIVPTCDYQRP